MGFLSLLILPSTDTHLAWPCATGVGSHDGQMGEWMDECTERDRRKDE